jgi:UDP-GlcNAc:undecaprenyl-phosphate GlcNAc-1-phosphate transferase
MKVGRKKLTLSKMYEKMMNVLLWQELQIPVSYLIWKKSIWALFAGFLFVFLSVPVYRIMLKKTELLDKPTEQHKTHHGVVPTAGGVLIFLSLVLTYILFFPAEISPWALRKFKSFFLATFLLFLLGAKDDMLKESANQRFIGQAIAGFFIFFNPDLRIQSFYGVLGVEELSTWFSILFSFFVWVVFVNAHNLADGIDGLLTTVVGISTAFFGFVHLGNQDQIFALVSWGTSGACWAFLYYNISKKQRIFLGNMGSLLLGGVVAFLTLEYLSHDDFYKTLPSWHNILAKVNKPVFAMSLSVYPLLDTLRVFVLRTASGKSPFVGDKNHLHHHLLSLGLSHALATACAGIFSIGAICTVVLLSRVFQANGQFIGFLLYVFCGLGLLFYCKTLLANKQA